MQFSVDVRNARLDAIETAIGTAPTLEIRTGAPPANCAAADAGTLLASEEAPADWLAAASAGVKAIANGPWVFDGGASAEGVAGHFRLKQGATCHMQGTVGAGGSGADMEVSNVNLTVAQPFSITGFSLTDGNA